MTAIAMNLRVAGLAALLLGNFAQGIPAAEPPAAFQLATPPSPAPGRTPLRLAGRGGIDRVQFVMDPPFSEHPFSATPAFLLRWGCRYESEDPSRAFSMEWLLENARIEADPAPDSHSHELRQMLNVHFVDGSTLKFDFDEVFPTDTVVHGHLAGLRITARKELQADLFRWARPIAGQAESCRFVLENHP